MDGMSLVMPADMVELKGCLGVRNRGAVSGERKAEIGEVIDE